MCLFVSVTKNIAKVTVETGSGPYTVYKNGLTILKTYKTNFTIDVNHGDDIQIKSKEACQGELLKTINLLEDIRAYPNPSNGVYKIYIPNDINNIGLELYDIQSRLIVSKTYNVINGTLSIDIQDKPSGIYFAKINSKKPIFIKLIKN